MTAARLLLLWPLAACVAAGGAAGDRGAAREAATRAAQTYRADVPAGPYVSCILFAAEPAQIDALAAAETADAAWPLVQGIAGTPAARECFLQAFSSGDDLLAAQGLAVGGIE